MSLSSLKNQQNQNKKRDVQVYFSPKSIFPEVFQFSIKRYCLALSCPSCSTNVFSVVECNVRNKCSITISLIVLTVYIEFKKLLSNDDQTI